MKGYIVDKEKKSVLKVLDEIASLDGKTATIVGANGNKETLSIGATSDFVVTDTVYEVGSVVEDSLMVPAPVVTADDVFVSAINEASTIDEIKAAMVTWIENKN